MSTYKIHHDEKPLVCSLLCICNQIFYFRTCRCASFTSSYKFRQITPLWRALTWYVCLAIHITRKFISLSEYIKLVEVNKRHLLNCQMPNVCYFYFHRCFPAFANSRRYFIDDQAICWDSFSIACLHSKWILFGARMRYFMHFIFYLFFGN